MNEWLCLSVTAPRMAEELISAVLLALGAGGVEIEDTEDYSEYQPSFGEVLPEIEQKEMILVRAYYPSHYQLTELKSGFDARLSELQNLPFDLSELTVTTETLLEEDWEEAWKQYFKPVRVSRDLTIVPSWTDYQPVEKDEKLIIMDPGMAFGTGTHPTTRLSLYALEQTLRAGEIVLDVGTGSGVLSIASVLLGADQVYAYDIDDVAVRVALSNIELNPASKKIQVSANNLLEGVSQKADVIVANILADILFNMLEDAYRLLNDEGSLILSGIIDSKVDSMLTASVKLGLQLETQMRKGEWNCLVLKKTKEPLIFG